MKKKITVIIVSVILLLAAAGAATTFFLLKKNSNEEKKDIIGNTVNGMFGEFRTVFPPLTAKGSAEPQRSLSAKVSLPSGLVGLSDKLDISVDSWAKNDAMTMLAGIKTGEESVSLEFGIAEGRFDGKLNANGHSYGLGLDFKGAADALDKSWLNPEISEDSPFDAEGYKKVRLALEKTEEKFDELYGSKEKSGEDGQTAEAFAERFSKLKEDLKKLPDVRTERVNKKKGNATVIIDINVQDIIQAVKHIYEFLDDEAVTVFADSMNVVLQPEGEADGESEREEILKEIEETGISVSVIAEIAENRISSLYITADYTEEDENSGTGGEKKTVKGKLTADISLNYDEKKIAFTVDEVRNGEKGDSLTGSYVASEDDSGYTWSAEVTVKEKDAEEEKHSLCAEYGKSDGAFSLNADGEEFAAGKFKPKEDGSLDLSVERIVIKYEEEYFDYGIGMKTEERSVSAKDFLTVSIGCDDSAKTEIGKQQDLFELDKNKREEMFGAEGIAADAVAVIQSVSESAKSARFIAADGVRVFPKKKAQARTEAILSMYLYYVNNTLGPQAFTLDSAYVCIYDEFDSKLFYLIDASTGTAYINAYTFVEPEVMKNYHEGHIDTQEKIVLHKYNISNAEVPCGEPNYRIRTCYICGFQLMEYTGTVSLHEYTESTAQIDSALRPGTKVEAQIRECRKCGEIVVDCRAEGYRLSFGKTEKGYEAKELSRSTEYYMYNPPSKIFEDYCSRAVVPVVLPPSHSGEKVIGIGENFCSYVQSTDTVIIGEGAEYIGLNAFAGASSIREIVLPASMKKIHDGALADCSGLERILFGGTEEQWKALDKGNNEKLLEKVPVVFNCIPGDYASLFEKFISPTDFIAIHKSMLSLENKSAQKLSSLVSGTSGVTVLKIKNAPKGGDDITYVAADDKNGTVLVSGSGLGSVYNRSGKNIGNFRFSDYSGAAGGEGYFFFVEYDDKNDKFYFNICDSGTLKQIHRIYADRSEYGSDYKYPCILNGKVYVLSDKALLEISISDGSIRKFTQYNNRYTMVCDKSRGCLLLRIYPNGAVSSQWFFFDPVSATTKYVEGPSYWLEPVSDKLGTKGSYIESYGEVVGGKTVEIDDIREYEVTPDGCRYLPTEHVQIAKGYTADRLIYCGTDCAVYTAHNSKNTACTVFVYKEKTKVVPVVLHDVEDLGNGVFMLWKKQGGSDEIFGTEAILVNVNK